ncbi:MAG: PDZ domain-containing protein [Ardenticatenales bacterium]|nr:PDZ domain-containing protein [Ardenticatenales bacterium]
MNDSPTTSGVRAPVALLAALGALLVGLAGGAAIGGMLGYVAGQRAAGGDVVVPAAIERLGLVPRAAEAPSESASDDDTADADGASEGGSEGESAGSPDADDGSDAAEGSDAADATDNRDAPGPGSAGRSKGGRQAGMSGDRPRLGVEVATEPLAVDDYASGARVMTVTPGSAAAAAGIREGDVIVAVDGAPVRTSDELAAAIAAHASGDAVALVVLRGEAELEFEATLGAAQP